MNLIEAAVIALLQGVCPRVFATVAPVETARPYITWQQYGGETLDYLGDDQPTARNAFLQINVWCNTPKEAATLIKTVELAMREITIPIELIEPGDVQTTTGSISAKPLGEHRGDYDSDMEVFGASQDFSVWGPT